jgi:hypothetical protein
VSGDAVNSQVMSLVNEATIPKQVTITNDNPTQWIYPILVGTNAASYNGRPYDTTDPALQDYRVYVGYTVNNQNYVGVPPGWTITFDVPEAL